MKIRVLWICNIIMPEFSEVYDVRPAVIEGWMSGMYKKLQAYTEYEIACCFPIIDECRMKSGKKNELYYFSFHASMDKKDYDGDGKGEFINIFRQFEPDIVHIWGSEYYHSKAAIIAAKDCGISDRIIIHIQGLVSAYSKYYNYGVDLKWQDYSCNGYTSMSEDEEAFRKRGYNEIEAIKESALIMGRTSWDKAFLHDIAPNTIYRYCGEILRKIFYENNEKWNINRIKKHSLFFSQANYPIKGMHLIIPAIAKLKEYYPDLSVIVAGNSKIALVDTEKETPYDRYILELIDRYDLRQAILFKGLLQADEMIENYITAHVFVCPSTVENSANSIGEAQLLGTPVVASYVGGTPDLIQHEKTGMLYQVDADYMFISCVKKIFDDDDFAMELSCREQIVAADRHDPCKVTKQLISIYQEIISGRKGID